jgi:hypothetical protein
MKKHPFLNLIAFTLCFSFTASLAFSQETQERVFGKLNPFTVEELPAGQLKTKLETLNPESKEKAMRWLHSLSFKEFDAAEHMRVDDNGGVFTVCPDGHGNCDGHTHQAATVPEAAPTAPSSTTEPVIERVSVSINTPPAYNSKPDAPYHLYLDFNGAIVTGKAWNTAYSVTSWDCGAWNLDANSTTFNDLEQAQMKEMWQRISEDYAPFNVNVTTDVSYDPVNYSGDKNRVGWLLFTDTRDKNNRACPHDGSGGVAYVGVFGRPDYFSTYQPAWVTPQGTPSFDSEAASHEFGHNLGLSHDGTTSLAYYGGHGSNEISWGPIMGTGYNRNVSQWSKGEYYKANQFQNDLAIITTGIPYRADDHGATPATATPLTIPDGITITSTTPENDPANSSTVNKGIIEQNTDVDVFSFDTGAGSVTLNVNPWKQSEGTFGGNLDVLMELYDDQGALVASANPAIQTRATIQTTLAAGTYYIYVKNIGAGTPSSATPSGYTAYGSIGQYFISGTVVEATPRLRVLSITPNVGDAGTTVSVAITGTLFQDTPTVALEKDGNTINGENVVFIDAQNLTCDFNLTGAALGEWNLTVTNPDTESATLPLAFTVQLAKIGFFKEFFDASNSLPAGWTTYTTTNGYNATEADPLWEIDSTSSQTPNNSAFASCPSVISTKYLESPSITLPNDVVDLKFSFWHDCDLETGYDGGTLEFSLDGGTTWFDVASAGSGVGFESNGYNQIISTAYRSPIAGKYAWSGDSNGYIQTVIAINDTVKYAGKNLKARWLLASDNFATSKGWNIDTVELTGSIYETPDPENKLIVSTDDDLSFSGNQGGPFGPTPQTYTLTNDGDRSLNWTASRSASWVTLSASSGTLAANASVTLSVSINSNAIVLPVGIHADTINITNLSMPDDVITRGVLLEVNSIPATVNITERFHTYDGSPKSVTVTTTPTGLPVDVTYNGSPTPPTNAGTYTVVATINHKRYAGSATHTMEIYQATSTVTTWPTAASIPLGQAVLSATLSGGSASVPGSFSYTSPATVLAVGTHAVPVTFTPTDNVNYANVSGTVNVRVYPVADLVRTTVSNVTNSGWTVVNLGKTYVSPVIVATPIYNSSTLPPVVTRIQNVTPTSFELRLDRADGLSGAVSMKVGVIVVNEGVYTVAQHGVKMEAVKFNSTLTASGTGAWNAEARAYQNTYTKPVVVGQVMSYNDSRWSAFWSRGSLATSPISPTSLNVGKHVGLDPAKTRNNETIGYIVIESGTGTIEGVRYRAAVGSDIVRGFGNSAAPYKYTLSGLTSVSTAAVSQTGMDGTEGSWAVLSGAPALTTTALKLHVAEDGFSNSLRSHTTEQVAFIVFQ